jgi:predicted CxxxxCH...CXXCH cytochrome family protein
MGIRRKDMHRWILIFSLLLMAVLAGGCSDQNGGGADTTQPHSLGASWLLPEGHAASAINGSPPCFGCHQVSGGPVAPNCSTCHTAGPPNFVLETCDSCHSAPPDGNSRPNRAGAHGAHNALPKISDACSSCHNGAGTGTKKHYDTSAPADMGFLTGFNAKTGPAAFSPNPENPGTGTCSNVSCHGGQQTPDWFSGEINVDQDCTLCHELGTAFQTPQYNSPYSGQHQFHVGTLKLACTICHDPAKLETGHFSGLDTPEFEGNPATTLQDFINYQSPTCTTNNAACHAGETRNWFTGGGGAPHPVPFLPPDVAITVHGAQAKQDLTVCQGCHATPSSGGTNPRFNVAIGSLTNGCEDCHNDSTAHPSVGARDGIHWYDDTFTHDNAGNIPAACELCHGANLQGPADTPQGVGPACTECHAVVPVGADASGCVSCHNTPPNGLAPAGNARPNRAGRHGAAGHAVDCSTCHSNGGFGTAAHFDFTPPADVTPPAGETITFSSNATNTTCNGSCHGMTHSNFTWY